MKVPVLTYHSGNVAGVDYQHNDHVALAKDLQIIAETGWRVVPLHWVVEQRLGLANRNLARCVALSSDDGCDLDVHDIEYPGFGLQRSFLGCLEDVRAQFEVYRTLAPEMTSFVIADPEARLRMDTQCLHGRNWLNDDWWQDYADHPQFKIACHSWDHNHPVMGEYDLEGKLRGDFFQINSVSKAEQQIDIALAFIRQKIAPHHCRYFAYPYGHANDFLREDYFPAHANRLGLDAAFSTDGEPVTMSSPRWNLPRYVCGWHWKSANELLGLLVEMES
jgi:hypothetical protein